MEREIREENNDNLLSSVFFAVKTNALLMAIIIAAVTICGLVYSFFQKPSYTASERVIYRAENTINETVKNNINTMNAFVYTVADFCDEGVVVDRANFYYADYLTSKEQNGQTNFTVDDYVALSRENDPYKGTRSSATNILAENISVSASNDEETVKFSFTVNYTDDNEKATVDKVKILIFAFDMECAETVMINGVEQNKYFDGINNRLIDYGTVGVTSNVSRMKTVLIALVLGVVVACVTVYVKSLLDTSIKGKEELERIAGVSMLASIEYQGGEEDGSAQ